MKIEQSISQDFTVLDASYILQVTPPTIYKMLKDGKLKGYVIGARSRRITQESVEMLRKGETK